MWYFWRHNWYLWNQWKKKVQKPWKSSSKFSIWLRYYVFSRLGISECVVSRNRKQLLNWPRICWKFFLYFNFHTYFEPESTSIFDFIPIFCSITIFFIWAFYKVLTIVLSFIPFPIQTFLFLSKSLLQSFWFSQAETGEIIWTSTDFISSAFTFTNLLFVFTTLPFIPSVFSQLISSFVIIKIFKYVIFSFFIITFISYESHLWLLFSITSFSGKLLFFFFIIIRSESNS